MEARETPPAPADGDDERVLRGRIRARGHPQRRGAASVRDAWLRLQTRARRSRSGLLRGGAPRRSEDRAAARGDARAGRRPVAMLVARIERSISPSARATGISIRRGFARSPSSTGASWATSTSSVPPPARSVRRVARPGRGRRRDLSLSTARLAVLPHRIDAPPLVSRQHVPSSEIHWELSYPTRAMRSSGALSSKKPTEDQAATCANSRPSTKDDSSSGSSPSRRSSTSSSRPSSTVARKDVPARDRRVVRRHARPPRADAGQHAEGLVPRLGRHGRRARGRVPPRRALPRPFPARQAGLRPRAGGMAARHPSPRTPDRGPLQRTTTARVLDYGVGDAEYKRRFGTRSWREGNVFIYARTFRGIRINLTRTVLLAGVGGARRILDRRRLRAGAQAALAQELAPRNRLNSFRVLNNLSGASRPREAGRTARPRDRPARCGRAAPPPGSARSGGRGSS